MSSPSVDALKTEIDQGKMQVGNIITATTGLPTAASALPYVDSASKLAATAVTASKLVYINSSSIPQTGTPPFALASSAASTTSTLLNFTGASTLSGTADLTQTLVKGPGTTFTVTGFVRVTVTDSGGNITDGDHYLQIGSLA